MASLAGEEPIEPAPRAEVMGLDPGEVVRVFRGRGDVEARPECRVVVAHRRPPHPGRRQAVGIRQEPAGAAQPLLDRVARAAQLAFERGVVAAVEPAVRPAVRGEPESGRGERVQVGPREQGGPGDPPGLARPIVVGPHPVGDEEDRGGHAVPREEVGDVEDRAQAVVERQRDRALDHRLGRHQHPNVLLARLLSRLGHVDCPQLSYIVARYVVTKVTQSRVVHLLKVNSSAAGQVISHACDARH